MAGTFGLTGGLKREKNKKKMKGEKKKRKKKRKKNEESLKSTCQEITSKIAGIEAPG